MGIENVRDMVDNYIEEYGIEMYINLDHSPSVEDAIEGIEAGFEFIHIDISQANHDATEKEISDQTREVVAYATLDWGNCRERTTLFWWRIECF